MRSAARSANRTADEVHKCVSSTGNRPYQPNRPPRPSSPYLADLDSPAGYCCWAGPAELPGGIVRPRLIPGSCPAVPAVASVVPLLHFLQQLLRSLYRRLVRHVGQQLVLLPRRLVRAPRPASSAALPLPPERWLRVPALPGCAAYQPEFPPSWPPAQPAPALALSGDPSKM